jgi:Fic family protein
LIKSLHFMMTQYDPRTNPGTWRRGDVYVRNDATGEVVYTGADAGEVPALMAELVAQMGTSVEPPLVRGAMAHLNLVMIHPFSDGNGRMARCLQTLVLAKEGILAPQFSSVEEYLGANTDAYYRILAEVGQGHWNPTGDATAWIRFMLTAHYRQNATLLRRVAESQSLWQLVEDQASTLGVHQRSYPTLFDAAQGRRITRSTYLASLEDPLSDAVATRDLRSLVGAGLLVAHGERRAREYRASPELAAMQTSARRNTTSVESLDPYARDADPTLF